MKGKQLGPVEVGREVWPTGERANIRRVAVLEGVAIETMIEARAKGKYLAVAGLGRLILECEKHRLELQRESDKAVEVNREAVTGDDFTNMDEEQLRKIAAKGGDKGIHERTEQVIARIRGGGGPVQ